MICNAPGCRKGFVLLRSYPGNELLPYPCRECGGTGFVHCCEGERPAPEGERRENEG
jgi:hypothetical protein